MSTQDRDNTLKALDRMTSVACEAAQAPVSLEDKVRFQRLYRELTECRKTIFKTYYVYEDALITVTKEKGKGD